MEVLNRDKAIEVLNRIMECELTGVIRYTHYSMKVCGYNRGPVAAWLQAQADEGLDHARRAGTVLTLLGGHPTHDIRLSSSFETDAKDILRESLEHEHEARSGYQELLQVCKGHSAVLESYARELIIAKNMHAEQVERLMRSSVPAWQSAA